MQQRLEYFVDLTDEKRNLDRHPAEDQHEKEHSNLYSSELAFCPGWHAPTLDIDGINVEVYESTTPGNYHLYIDKGMPWATYKKLLEALHDAGIIQEGFYTLSLARGATFLRKPGIEKKPEDVLDS